VVSIYQIVQRHIPEDNTEHDFCVRDKLSQDVLIHVTMSQNTSKMYLHFHVNSPTVLFDLGL
jgi:hypothetical protein